MFELFGEIAVGDLIRSRVGALAAVTRENVVHPVDHFGCARIGRQGQGDAVERAVHIVGSCQGAFRHPQDCVALEVGHDRAGLDLVDELRRERDAHQRQFFLVAVDDDRETIAGAKALGLGKSLADHRLVIAQGVDQAACTQIDSVEFGVAVFPYGDQHGGCRVGVALNIEVDAGRHAGLYDIDARDLADAVGDAIGSALDRGEDIGETVLAIERGLGLFQRLKGAERHDEGCDAAGDD